MNVYSIHAIYRFEMARAARTLMQSLAAPVLATALYFVVFGSAIGSRMSEIGSVPYGSFIVPGLTLLAVLTQSVSNAAFGIYMPRYSGAIYEILSAPLSPTEIVIGYVGAAATKSLVLAAVILLTARVFVPYEIVHPFWALIILVLCAVSFSLLGFIVGLCVDGWDKLDVVPSLIITPLAFLGGSFYSLNMLSPTWQTVSHFNPMVYLVDAFRWAFFDITEFNPMLDVAFLLGFLLVCVVIIGQIFRTGYRLQH